MKVMNKLVACIFLLAGLWACTPDSRMEIQELTDAVTLDSGEVIIEFDDKYPASLMKKDSRLFVIQVQSDTCISVVDVQTGRLVASLGTVGKGDKDLMNPNFVLSTANDGVLLNDANLQKLVRITHSRDGAYDLESMKYPEALPVTSEMNLSGDYVLGRKVDAFESDMFFIYDRNQKEVKNVPCFPPLAEPIKDYNFTYAPVLALNEEKGRIIAGMYFFDMFHVYDLEGNRLKTVKLSEDCYPSINRNFQAIDFSKGYNGIIRAFPTHDYCYLLRIVNTGGDALPENWLLKIDWKGNVEKAYRFVDSVSGQFYVDEKENKVYIIKDYVRGDDEIFSVVAYPLI